MDTNQNTADYRLILKEELATRCKQNSRYSLRAFARDIKIAPSRLCEVLNGKQGLSRTTAEQIADALGYLGSEKDRFCDLVEATHARSKKDREKARKRLASYKTDSETTRLKNDAFKAIADWYHLAVLELVSMEEFDSNPRWIAKKLGLSEIEVQLAVDRLIRLGLLEKNNETLTLAQGDGFVPGDVPSEHIRKFHGQILDRAKKAMHLQTLDQREYGTYIMAIDKNKMKEAKQAIRDFQHKFCKQMGEAQSKDSLYCLSFQFFDLMGGG